jgi:hypothetical protein
MRKIGSAPNPPLCINRQQLCEGFAIFDRALEIMDKAVES